jgi:hypothetical protein
LLSVRARCNEMLCFWPDRFLLCNC